MHRVLTAFIYLMFLLSGAAALMYQVVWVRSLTLIFGGSHLAVTAVLSIFMAGLAIGGYAIGRYVDSVRKPLRVYGLLEIGIALFAVVFVGLSTVYPSLYGSLAQGRDDAPLFLFLIRALFSVVALIVPTVFMGGTLPVLTRFISRQSGSLRGHLSFLYGFNTLGAVIGAVAAGFYFLRFYSVGSTLAVAIGTNFAIGIASLLLQERAEHLFSAGTSERTEDPTLGETPAEAAGNMLPLRLVLIGVGVSGFCALGYEVLWTRILTIVVGASVYGFTTMLAAFLTGIALGSEAYGLVPKLLKTRKPDIRRSVSFFGIVQIIIGVSALLVTVFIRDLPMNAMRLQDHFQAGGAGFFGAKVWVNFVLAFFYMIIPAFFMGVAFPLAGRVHAEYRKRIGAAVGEVLTYNTVGAILGAAVSGFLMIYLFGIERSLQMLVVINIGYGFLVLASLKGSKALLCLVSCPVFVLLAFLAVNQEALRIWDTKYFAIFRNNQPESFRTPEVMRDTLDNTDVLYYAEGVEAIVSSIKVKGGEQSFITNGRVEASSHLQAQQCQYTLGHLPMLLNKNPRSVLVVGTGSGMTLGAVSVHPGVERVTLVELEPKVLGVARTFEKYNHCVLDNPKLRILFNDGRNFLQTTKEKFDVITADPIHPWFRGAGYLYTTEYFRLAARHLNPGGVVCQWLPIYELTPKDVMTVVKTFGEHFRYTMLWLTHYDAEIVGSNEPIVIDEVEMERRIAQPGVSEDLKRVMMGSAHDFLSYFVLGAQGMQAFAEGGTVNTDDNLYLEFSAPFSIGDFKVMEQNVSAIIGHRESILPYLVKPKGEAAQQEQIKRWEKSFQAQAVQGPALALFLGGKTGTPQFISLLRELETGYPWYAPGRFLRNEYASLLSLNPRLLQTLPLALTDERGAQVVIEISVVLAPVSRERGAVIFADNSARVVYGQAYISGADYESTAGDFARDVLSDVRAAYVKASNDAVARGRPAPQAQAFMHDVRAIIAGRTQGLAAKKQP